MYLIGPKINNLHLKKTLLTLPNTLKYMCNLKHLQLDMLLKGKHLPKLIKNDPD